VTNTIIVCVFSCLLLALGFVQWRFIFRNRIRDLESDNARLRRLDKANQAVVKSRQEHIKALQDMLEIYQTTPRSLKMAVVLMDHTPGALDVAMRSIGITLPGETVKKTGKAS